MARRMTTSRMTTRRMTIRKGQPWGTEGPVAGDVPTACDDASLAALVHDHRDHGISGSDAFVARVASGDLLATVGGAGPPPALGEDPLPITSQLLPMDLGYVRLDEGPERPFVAHVLANARGWRGQCMVVMNGAWYGDWYLGPRAHPNDGLLDVTVGELGFRDRMMAKKRVKSGTHLPHPNLEVRRVGSLVQTLERLTPVRIDGVLAGQARRIEVRLDSDAFVLAL